MSFERVSAFLLKGYFLVAIKNLSAMGLHTLTDNPKLGPDRVMKPLQCHSDTCVASVFVSRVLRVKRLFTWCKNKEQNHWHYLSIAGEGSVVKQEISTEEHHNSIIDTQDCPVNKGGPLQQGVLSNISGKGKQAEWDAASLDWVHV